MSKVYKVTEHLQARKQINQFAANNMANFRFENYPNYQPLIHRFPEPENNTFGPFRMAHQIAADFIHANANPYGRHKTFALHLINFNTESQYSIIMVVPAATGSNFTLAVCREWPPRRRFIPCQVLANCEVEQLQEMKVSGILDSQCNFRIVSAHTHTKISASAIHLRMHIDIGGILECLQTLQNAKLNYLRAVAFATKTCVFCNSPILRAPSIALQHFHCEDCNFPVS